MNGLLLGLIGGAVSGLATTLGAVPTLVNKGKGNFLLRNVNMDFVIGLMLSAAAFSLILPAYQKVLFIDQSHNNIFEFFVISLAIFLGTLFITVVGKCIERMLQNKEHIRKNKKAMLFVIAMMVHNFPEGLASGASMTMQDPKGYSLLSAIAFQNIPEGLTTALSFISMGLNPLMAFLGTLLTGVVELVGGIIGGYMSVKIDGILPLLMAFAGGAMMNVVLVELFERFKTESFRLLARPSFLLGMGLVLVLNNL